MSVCLNDFINVKSFAWENIQKNKNKNRPIFFLYINSKHVKVGIEPVYKKIKKKDHETKLNS